MDQRRYRILSLDGGGSWALIQVKALMRIFPEATTGHDVLRNFHLVAANSGGSIVAAGLAADLPLDELLRLFMDVDHRTKIFVKLPWHDHLFYRLLKIAPKYDAAAKLKGLREALRRTVP